MFNESRMLNVTCGVTLYDDEHGDKGPVNLITHAQQSMGNPGVLTRNIPTMRVLMHSFTNPGGISY